jgi:kynureninase
MEYKLDCYFAKQLDEHDPLDSFRKQFHIPKIASGKEAVYFCGHSLGLQPVTVQNYIEQILDSWKTLGIEGYSCGNSPWLYYSESLKPKIGKIVGARTSEVAIMHTLTINLHLLMVSFYKPTRQKYKILIESHAFPSDQYAIKSQIQFHGYDPTTALLEIQPRNGETCIRTEDIESLLDREGSAIALVLLGGVNYLTGQFLEIQKITQRAHSYGCLVGFDLAHAVGNVPLALHNWNVDFAVWCNYKYINAGPAAVAACFVHEKYAESFDLPRFAGWWGNDIKTRFLMKPDFHPATGAEGWQVSNANTLSLASLAASLDIFEAVGMERLIAKSKRLNGYLEFLLEDLGKEHLTILTPRNPDQRGCQLSLRMKKDKSLIEKLKKRGVFCDWREPDVLRVAPVPLYNRFIEIFDFVQILKDILNQ